MPEKRFCPLRSTSSKNVYCSSDCMWYIPSDDSDQTCAVVHNLTTLGYILSTVEKKKK